MRHLGPANNAVATDNELTYEAVRNRSIVLLEREMEVELMDVVLWRASGQSDATTIYDKKSEIRRGEAPVPDLFSSARSTSCPATASAVLSQ